MLVAAPPTAAVLAWRIRFVPEASPGERVLAQFTDPRRCVAVAESCKPEELLRPGTGFEGELYFLFLPGGSATSPEWQRRAETWMARPDDAAVPTIELVLRSDRILWRPGRAVVHGAVERQEETLAGLIEFAFYEGELRRLEREVAADWPAAEADVDLTHEVGAATHKRWGHVARMTERIGRRRIRFARLERHLEKASPALSGPARRLVAELLTQAETLDRLRAVDDGIEVQEDLYELANDRLSEFSYFWREHRLELWIVVLLVAEVVLLLAELGLRWLGG
jgi:hypothetical protein